MAGLPAARDAIREGTPVAYWRAGITHTRESIGQPRTEAPAIIRFASIRRARSSPSPPAMRPTPRIAHADRAKATAIGLDAIKKTYGVDASGYELEVVERSFPAGKTELTWRSQATKYGHVEQLHVNLQGEKLILIERSLQRPRGYEAPATPMAMQIFKGIGPGGARRRVRDRLGIRALLPVQDEELGRADPAVAAGALRAGRGAGRRSAPSAAPGVFQSLLGDRRDRDPAARHRAARAERRDVVDWPSEPGAHVGRRTTDARPPLRARRLGVARRRRQRRRRDGRGRACFADWAALQVPGFEPSISRELNIVDASFGSMIGDTLSGSAFIVLGVAFVVEVFDRFRVNPIVSTIVVAIAAGPSRPHRIRKRSCRPGAGRREWASRPRSS